MASDYLTPYDELIERTQLGERTMQAANAQNPLYQRDQAILAKEAGVPVPTVPGAQPVTAAAPTTAQPNPFIRPPVPLSTMPVEKQIEWQKMQQDAETRQAALDRAALETTSLRRKEELDREGVKQATSLLGETGTLRPDDLANYPVQRGELMRKYPVGAMTAEAKNILSQYDTIYNNALQINKETQGRQDTASLNRESNRREGAVKLAADLGGDAIAKFYQVEKDQGTEAAIQATMGVAATGKKENLVAMLLNTGMTQEDINKKFYNPQGEFLYPAAEAQAKLRVNPQQEASRAEDMMTDLLKQRREAGYKEGKPTTKWPDYMEDAFQRSVVNYNQKMERAGVKGMPRPAPAGNVTIATPTPTPAAAKPTATPSPTPPPPPLNPQYPEQWKNGQRYIQMEDGKWHKSKVQ